MTSEHHPSATQAPSSATPEAAETPDVAALAAERDEWKDKAYRAAAELENARRRHAQEVAQARDFALQKFASDLLPVADNFARALAADGTDAHLKEGVTMVAAALSQVFARHGIAPVNAAAGQPLNPELHQAMAQVPSAHPAGHVVTEMQPGYTLNGRLLRPAFVTVSAGPETQNN